MDTWVLILVSCLVLLNFPPMILMTLGGIWVIRSAVKEFKAVKETEMQLRNQLQSEIIKRRTGVRSESPVNMGPLASFVREKSGTTRGKPPEKPIDRLFKYSPLDNEPNRDRIREAVESHKQEK